MQRILINQIQQKLIRSSENRHRIHFYGGGFFIVKKVFHKIPGFLQEVFWLWVQVKMAG